MSVENFKMLYLIIVMFAVISFGAGFYAFLNSSLSEKTILIGNISIIVLSSVFAICLIMMSIRGIIINSKLKKINEKNNTLEIMSYLSLAVLALILIVH